MSISVSLKRIGTIFKLKYLNFKKKKQLYFYEACLILPHLKEFMYCFNIAIHIILIIYGKDPNLNMIFIYVG